MRSVIVIGGGLAGLASALALTEAGFRVRLLEKRPHLGGRATSYVLPGGEHVDNCQHVTLGCCTNLDDFYRRAGAGGNIRYYDRLFFLDPRGRRGVIESSGWPAPLHLAPSFLLFPSLGWTDKLGIARAMRAILRGRGWPADAEGITMLDWLRRHRQTPGAIERFWRVVLVSALDEELDRTAARYGVEVFWKAFLAHRAGYRVGIPTVPLADLYDGCRRAVVSRGGEVRTRAAVRRIVVEDGRVAGAELDGGELAVAGHYILAVPHDAVRGLLPGELAAAPEFAGLERLRTSPITGVHFWLDRAVMDEPFVTLLDRTTQWVFNKSLLYGGGAAAAGVEAADASHLGGGSSSGHASPDTRHSTQYLQLVISASYDMVPMSRQEIIALCWRELAETLPRARDARLLKATVIKETAATFSPAPDCDRWRPGARTSLPNLLLAGDWTATGWPSTMEGAVRSGYRAAEEVLAAHGDARSLVVPDLEVEPWARRM